MGCSALMLGGGSLWEQSGNLCEDSSEKRSYHFNPLDLICHHLQQAVDLELSYSFSHLRSRLGLVFCTAHSKDLIAVCPNVFSQGSQHLVLNIMGKGKINQLTNFTIY